MIIYAPNTVTSKSQPLIWRVGLDSSAGTTYTDLAKIEIVVNINGVPQPVSIRGVQDDGVTYKFAEIDVQGLIEGYFLTPETPNTITSGQPTQDFASYYEFFAPNQIASVYISVTYWYFDSLGVPTLDPALNENSFEIFVYATTVQQTEDQNLAPYLNSVGQKQLSYRNFSTNISPTLGYEENTTNYPDKNLTAFLSFFWRGDSGFGAISFVLRDNAGGFYGAATKLFNDVPVRMHDIRTVMYAPQNLRAVSVPQWLSTPLLPAFLTNLNNTQTWNRVRVQVSLAIGLGGGAYAFLPLFFFYYGVDFNVNCGFAPLYIRNTLCAFDAHTVDLTRVTRQHGISSTRANFKAPYVYTNSLDANTRTNTMFARTMRAQLQRETKYKLSLIGDFLDSYLRDFGIMQASHIYTDARMFEGEYKETRPYSDLYPLIAEDASLSFNKSVNQEVEIIVSPANSFKAI
jgi:hypothetical protein